jgi:hypothetical protein
MTGFMCAELRRGGFAPSARRWTTTSVELRICTDPHGGQKNKAPQALHFD